MESVSINEEEIKNIKAIIEATAKLGHQQGMSFTDLKYIVHNPLDVILAISIDRLEKSSKILNRLTIVLIALTVILAILTGISVWKLF